MIDWDAPAGLPREPGPIDVVAAVRAAEWEIWVAWMLGECPHSAFDRMGLPSGHPTRCRWADYSARWHRRTFRRPPGSSFALDHWQWVTGAAVARRLEPGSALYVVSRRRLRLRIELDIERSLLGSPGRSHSGLRFARRCDPALPGPHRVMCGCEVKYEPVTIDADAPSPRGMRRRWWPRELEIPCPDWREAAVGAEVQLQPDSADSGRDLCEFRHPVAAGEES